MASHIWFRGENGMLHVHDVPLPPGIQHRLDNGDLTRVNEDGSPWREPQADAVEPPHGDRLPDGPSDAPPLPKRTEPRATWTEFAVSQGMDRDEAAAMSKAQLIETLTGK